VKTDTKVVGKCLLKRSIRPGTSKNFDVLMRCPFVEVISQLLVFQRVDIVPDVLVQSIDEEADSIVGTWRRSGNQDFECFLKISRAKDEFVHRIG
jgi:hypothetical protein